MCYRPYHITNENATRPATCPNSKTFKYHFKSEEELSEKKAENTGKYDIWHTKSYYTHCGDH